MKLKGLCVSLACGLAISACGSKGGSAGPARDAGIFEAAGAAGAAGAGNDAEAGANSGEAGNTGDTADAASMVLDQSGGSLELDGVAINVPAGALTDSATLTLKRVASSVPGYTMYSDVFELLPASITFEKPVSIALPYKGDQARANLFATSADGTRYAWVGTTSTSNVITGGIATPARFFAADGASYTETPDEECTRVDVVDGVFSARRAVSLLVRATDCQGRTLGARKADGFTALEDGEPLAQGTVALRDPAPLAPYVSVLVDMAVLKAAPRETADGVTAALASLTSPALRVGVSVYGGSDVVTELVAPTLDADAVSAAVKQLATYRLPAKPSGASFAAAAALATESKTLADAFRQRNAGGALAEGFVIWISALNSAEKAATQSDALATISDSGDPVVAVSLGDLTIDAVGNDEWFAAPDSSGLGRALAAAAQRVNALIASSYWLGYCSGETQGAHGVGARVQSTLFELGRNGVFDATDSLPGCDATAPLDDCGDRECGGAGCGACDDTTSQCDTSTGKCQSFCDSQDWCGDASHDNPNGYAQKCADSPTATECSKACVNLQTDAQNCGKCGTVCPAQSVCTDGSCVCSAGAELCDGVCIDVTLDARNCGKCGAACDAGAGCFSGNCAGSCPTSLHGPTLVKVPTPSGGILCIDATEVTRGQYQEFLTDRAGDTSGQAPECAWNLYFDPPDYCTERVYSDGDPTQNPQECVDWCDAAAFCSWSGKRLCGGLDQRHVALTDLADATKDAWFNACSDGGTSKYPFGNTCQSFPCQINETSATEVGRLSACQGSGAYAGVFDLIGNVQEWEDSCDGYNGVDDRCEIRGGDYGLRLGGDCLSIDQLGQARCSYTDFSLVPRDSARQAVGFRCCAQ